MLSFGCFCSIINNCIGASQHHGEKIIKDGDQAQWCYSLMPAVKITEKKYIHNMNAEQCEVILRFLNETNKGKKNPAMLKEGYNHCHSILVCNSHSFVIGWH